jgi:hypothetical protein
MHDLFVLFGTLGGISLFGILGIILGPIVAALFITIWEIYGKAFEAYLPDVGPLFNRGKLEVSEPTPPGAAGGSAGIPESDLTAADDPLQEQAQKSDDATGKMG